MALSLSAMLSSYRISSVTGFAMDKPSPTEFTDPALNPWLEIGNRIPALLNQSTRDHGVLRTAVRSLPILSAEKLASIEECRLAYVILTLLAQAYIWGNAEAGEEPSQILPPSVAVPLLEISKELEIQPGCCYSSGSIWFYTEDPNSGEEKAVCSITGTPDEDHFNLTAHRVERIGGRALIQGLMAARFAGQANSKEAAKCLNNVADAFKDCKVALEKMREGCDPDVFYFKIRPYLVGSNALEGGVLYQTTDGTGERVSIPGTTAAQSPIFQSMDVILGVTHPTERTKFVQSMRASMPACHIRFLEDIQSLPSIRKFVQQSKQNIELTAAYNGALLALKAFRDEHIKIVTLYVLSPSKRAATRSQSQPQPQPQAEAQENKSEETKDQEESKPDVERQAGTGGSGDLFVFLKGMRDDTKNSTL